MTHLVDVFNGDADGLCALHQLRLAEPPAAADDVRLVTGLKRDIALLPQVVPWLEGAPAAAGETEVTVLDLSLDRDRAALGRVLAMGARVRYFDHHFAGTVPAHPHLQAVLDPAPEVCTSVLVDRHLGGRFRPWTVVAAFGDNLAAAARSLAAPLRLDAPRLQALRVLGEALNYNGYGDCEADVAIHPRELCLQLHRFADPWVFHATPVAHRLVEQRRGDLEAAQGGAPLFAEEGCAAYLLPAQPWSGRVIGTFANELANSAPQRAHAVLKANADGTFAASVRAPLLAPLGADALCRAFPGGGGRAGAAGIDRLEGGALDRFLAAFRRATWHGAR